MLVLRQCVDLGVLMTDLRATIRRILGDHLPDAKDYARSVKVCTCGHEVPIGDMQARQEHLIDVLTRALTPLVHLRTALPYERARIMHRVSGRFGTVVRLRRRYGVEGAVVHLDGAWRRCWVPLALLDVVDSELITVEGDDE